MTYRGAYFKALKRYNDDLFTLTTLCHNDKIKANLGPYVKICEEAELNIHMEPWATALHHLSKVTFLCGNESCSDFLRDLTQTPGMFALLVLVLLLSPWILLKLHHLGQEKWLDFREEQRIILTMTENGKQVLPTRELVEYKKED